MATMTTPCGISSKAVGKLLTKHLLDLHAPSFIPDSLRNYRMQFEQTVGVELQANAVVHPVTKETITNYEKLANDPVMQEVWNKAMCTELGRLAH